MPMRFVSPFVLALVGWSSMAQAQTATATAPTTNPGGPNQAQQGPSGGATAPNGTALPNAGKAQIGEPTVVEREEQQKSSKDVQICKGC